MARWWLIFVGCLFSGIASAAEPAARELEPDPPAAEEAAADTKPAVVLVLPFSPVDDDEDTAWIGRAIGQTLSADLSIDRRLRISTHRADPPADAEAALEEAELAAADFVVFGVYQKLEGEIRITGQVLEAASGEVKTGIKATGPLRELFTLQDLLVHQIRLRLLPREARIPDAPAESEPADSESADSRTPRVDEDETFDVLGVARPRTPRRADWWAPNSAPAPALAAAAYRYRFDRPYVPYYSGYYGFSSVYYGGYYRAFSYHRPTYFHVHPYCPPGVSLRFNYRSGHSHAHIKGHSHGLRSRASGVRRHPVGRSAPVRVLTPRGGRP